MGIPFLVGMENPLINKSLTWKCFFFGVLVFQGCTYYFGNTRVKQFNRQQLALIPAFSSRPEALSFKEKIELGYPLLAHWAIKDLKNWKENGKTAEPRIMIAKLALKRDVEAVNKYIQSLEPWGIGGSTWAFNKKGDYDFTEINLCNLLYLFKDKPDLLYPETAEHIVNKLLIEDGNKPKTSVPHTLGLMRDTENHILMKETTRYLKNQWLYEKTGLPGYDNHSNGMQEWYLKHLEEAAQTGPYEFNAKPYIGYSIIALLTLHAHTNSDTLRQQAERVLDLLNWEYALGSYEFKKASPFRRRLEKANDLTLYTDQHTALMHLWKYTHNRDVVEPGQIPYSKHQTLLALMLNYQLPDTILAWTEDKPHEYFVRIGHGRRASPEIYSGGPGYLISAGGVQRGRRSQIVARPIALILDDAAETILDCFHIWGRGKMKKWNNTGVYERFACNNQPVFIPKRFIPKGSAGGWMVFQPYEEKPFFVAVYNAKELGLMVIFRRYVGNVQTLANMLVQNNPDASKLYSTMNIPSGPTITYDLLAKKKYWVIQSVDGKRVDRNHDQWPRISGKLE